MTKKKTVIIGFLLLVLFLIVYFLFIRKPGIFAVGEKSYATLQDAIDSITESGTIEVLGAVPEYNTVIVIDGKHIQINLNGQIIKVKTNDDNALQVRNGGSLVSNNGEWVLTTTYEGASAAYADENGSIDIKAQLEATGRYAFGAFTTTGGNIKIEGRITVAGESSYGVCATNKSQIEIDGNVEVKGDFSTGVFSGVNSIVKISGDVTAIGEDTYGADSYTGEITIRGEIKTTHDDLIWKSH